MADTEERAERVALRAQISAQVPTWQKRELGRLMRIDQEHGLVKEGGEIRLALKIALPIMAEMTPADRLREMAAIMLSSNDA